MKEEIIKDALQIQEERASEQAKVALDEEGTMLDVLLVEQKRIQDSMASLEIGSKSHMTAIVALDKVKSLIDKYSGIEKNRRREDKAEDAAIGINSYRAKKEIEQEFKNSDFPQGLPKQTKGEEIDHDNLDQDLTPGLT